MDSEVRYIQQKSGKTGLRIKRSPVLLVILLAIVLGSCSGSEELPEGATIDNEVILESVDIECQTTDIKTDSIPQEMMVQFAAVGVFSNGSTTDISDQVTWDFSNPSCVQYGSKTGQFAWSELGDTTLSVKYEGDTTSASKDLSDSKVVTITDALVTKISIDQESSITCNSISYSLDELGLDNGEVYTTCELPLIGYATYTNKSVIELTDNALLNWESGSAGTATISADGVVTGITSGKSTVTLTYDNSFTAKVDIIVLLGELKKITVDPSSDTSPVGYTRTYTVTGHYYLNDTVELESNTLDNSSITWESNDTNIATFVSPGVIEAVSAGSVTTTASLTSNMSVTDTAEFSVTDAEVERFESNIDSITLYDGDTTTLSGEGIVITGYLTDNSSVSIDFNDLSWTFSCAGILTIDGSDSGEDITGYVGSETIEAIGTGSCSLVYEKDGVSSYIDLNVMPAKLDTITVTSNGSTTMPDGTTLQLKATGTYSDNSTANITSLVDWESSDNTSFPVDDLDNKGLVTANAPTGTANITATYTNIIGNAISDSITVTATAATLESLEIQECTDSNCNSSNTIASNLINGTHSTTYYLMVMGTYSDGDTEAITGTGVWTGTDGDGVSCIGTANGGIVPCTTTAAESEMYTIDYSNSGIEAETIHLLVTPDALSSIAITASDTNVPLGTSVQLTAMGTYGSESLDISGMVTWPGSTGGFIIQTDGTVTNDSASEGSIISISASRVNIDGDTISSGSIPITATAATLESLEIQECTDSNCNSSNTIASNLINGTHSTTYYLMVMGTYSDGDTEAITGTGVWTGTDGNGVSCIGTVSGGIVPCSTTSATSEVYTIDYSNSGINANTIHLLVTPDALDSILITASDTDVPRGTSVKITAKGTYGLEELDISGMVTWLGSTGGFIVQTDGTVTNYSANPTDTITISASRVNIDGDTITSGSITITAKDPIVTGYDLTPEMTSDATTDDNYTIQGVATYSDDATSDVSGTDSCNLYINDSLDNSRLSGNTVNTTSDSNTFYQLDCTYDGYSSSAYIVVF